MSRTEFAAFAAALLSAGCAPTLASNQSFLTPEDLKIAPNGYASLKTTGETFDLGPIQKEENRVDRIEIVKLHGNFIVIGDGYKHAWKLYPAGTDEMHYKPLKLEPGARGFSQPELEVSGNCALLKWQKGGSPAQVYVNADGDFDDKNCPK
jgi:hypothetical protein